MKNFLNLSITAGILFCCATVANALPALQLDIQGGTYVEGATVDDNTILAPAGDVFDLYAIFNPKNGTNLTFDGSEFYLSIAVMPKVDVAQDFGSFSINGTDIAATGDMVYGTPPVALLDDPNGPQDVSPHGIFDTYYKEVAVTFSSSDKMKAYNTQDKYINGGDSWAGPATMIDPTGAMYYSLFQIDTTNLHDVNIHFDLYGFNRVDGTVIKDWDVAPYSHDASSNIPEPGNMILFGTCLIGLVGVGRFRVKKHPDSK